VSRQLQVACTSDHAAEALVEYLQGKGYMASADGATVRTDARYRVVSKAPTGLLLVDY
jgi:hypothetical protein